MYLQISSTHKNTRSYEIYIEDKRHCLIYHATVSEKLFGGQRSSLKSLYQCALKRNDEKTTVQETVGTWEATLSQGEAAVALGQAATKQPSN